jgi:hypothetical protein
MELFPHHHKSAPVIGIWILGFEFFLGFEEGFPLRPSLLDYYSANLALENIESRTQL